MCRPGSSKVPPVSRWPFRRMKSSACVETVATRNLAHLTWSTDSIAWIVAVAPPGARWRPELRLQAGHEAAK